ncbi:MAG TPA: arginine repressor [Candidatus Kapabacteria bacterium]|nr:arginine repressor [Candidatus Kapabacteria bacterium]
MSKQRRLFLIKEIISRKSIGHQDELLDELGKRGEDVNQATLSRDLRDLGVSRTQGSEGPRYVLPGEGHIKRLQALLSYEITSITANENLVVVKTLAGRAHGVAEQIDHLRLPSILATLAGDNTIFIAPVSVKQTATIEKQLKKLITEPTNEQ